MAFNKMFVMLPVMLAARKIDGEDPNIVFMLRCGYGSVQIVILLLVAYIYITATTVASASGEGKNRIIYVPPPPQPFDDPNAKGKKYTETTWSAYVISQARSLLGSTIFGTFMTVGLHLYKGMVVGLAMQIIMGPLNLMDNNLVKCLLMGAGLNAAAEEKIFGEVSREDLTEDDTVVDGMGNPVELKKKDVKSEKDSRSLEEVLQEVWWAAKNDTSKLDADMKILMSMLKKGNINFQTKETQWTPVMIMAAVGVKRAQSALRQLRALGADPAITDEDGWNAMHWAAFHGSVSGMKVLLDAQNGYDAISLGLHEVADKFGKTPLDLAHDEGKDEVKSLIEKAMVDTQATEEKEGTDTGLRKRK
eukprot:CAMPEP_0183296550 /NCGR_PEP_ID=MMETSP0160_2-20130417/4050_1 /TAXON_ID=2839 ORGANISM="Odontella Sinensis, Strain Grunow 1884" /NCGR_SAMPLE_ID=MMETSP0160_2 /ASSEMBLY_ACC=CAM_ASM_000250 /LENGTH=361 /DNA_ID=CAMNT_0025458171 /DNA_START=77 /DNA_END=1162 /DNA_ORIENTATION=-